MGVLLKHTETIQYSHAPYLVYSHSPPSQRKPNYVPSSQNDTGKYPHPPARRTSFKAFVGRLNGKPLATHAEKGGLRV